MHDEIQRMIERRNRGDDPNRLLGGESPSIGAAGGKPHRNFATREIAQLIGSVEYAVDRAGGFDDRIRQRLAALSCDLSREMIAPRFQQRCKPPQDSDSFMRLQPAIPIAKGLRGGLQFGFKRRFIIRFDRCDRCTVKGLHNLKHRPPRSGQIDIRRAVAQFFHQYARVLGIVDRHVDNMDSAAFKGGFQRRRERLRRVTREPLAP